MIIVNGKKYSTEYVCRAIAALETAGVPDDGIDMDDVAFTTVTQKGELRVSIFNDEHHSVLVDLMADEEQCEKLNIRDNLCGDQTITCLPLTTIEIPDNEVDDVDYRKNSGKIKGCPRIMLYGKMEDDVSDIVMIDGDGLCIIPN